MPLKRRRVSPEVVAGKKRRKAEEAEDEVDDSLSQPDFHCNSTMGTTTEAGILEKISLRNFMCHERLTIPVGSHVNFIVGNNSSGKSAIMTAVVAGLGGKAAATNRGSSIKSFIKTGKSTAEISISLRNRGPDAYKHSVYGNTITIERKLNIDGGGGYKIKNVDGRVCSTKKEELISILDQFNIQVDNPVAILNQDTSRDFLHSKNPKDKYKFFLKATQLEQMKHDYNEATKQKEISIDILTQKQQALPTLEKEVLEWEQKYKALEAVDELREKVRKLKDEMAWALVTEKERGLDPIAKDLRIQEARRPKFVAKIQENEARVKASSSKFREIQQEMKQLGEGAKSLTENHDEAKSVRDGKKQFQRKIQREMAGIQNETKSTNRDRQQIIDRLQELKNSAVNNYEKQECQRQKKINKFTEEIEKLRADQEGKNHEQEKFQMAVDAHKQSLYGISQEEQNIKQGITTTKRALDNLKASRNNKMKRFGHYMPDVVRKIEEASRRGKFHQRPRGPLGANVSLTDPKWALATEVCLKDLLYSFCCHDHHDENELQKIFRASNIPKGRAPSVIVNPFRNEVYNVSRYKAGGKNPSVYDILQTDDPVVKNCLIDQRQIESVVVFEDVVEARSIMLHKPPKNCKEGFAINGDQLLATPSFRYYSHFPKNAKAKLLTANMEEDIENLKEELSRLQHELTQKQLLTKQLNTKAAESTNQVRNCKNQLQKIRTQLNTKIYEINELQAVEEPAPQEDIKTLEEDAEQFTQQIKQLGIKLEEVKVRLNNAKEETDQSEENFQTISTKLQTYAERTSDLKERLSEAESVIEMAKNHRRHYLDKLVEHDDRIAELQRQHDDYVKEIEADIEKANTFCERIKTRRTASNLESEINQINKRITVEEKQRGSREEITKTYYDKFNAFKKIKKEVNQLHNFLKRLGTTMVARQQKYSELRRMIAMRAKYYFIVMLSNRQYNGQIHFDHKREALNISVQPTGGADQPSAMAKDMKALSGGERSFSTVCYILALWDAMESPFRMLDEFDIFMDMVNRRIAMALMLDSTENQSFRQFIFLTPLDMSYLSVQGRNVKIFQMHPPVRSQPALPYEPPNRRRREDRETDSPGTRTPGTRTPGTPGTRTPGTRTPGPGTPTQ